MRQPTFEDTYPELWSVAYRVAYRITGSRESAEDIAQVTTERAFHRWRSVNRYANAWVARVATNQALDLVRRVRTADSVAADLEPRREHLDPLVEERLALTGALLTLPERQRSVVALRFLYGYSVTDTAAALGISDGSVKTHSHRGLAAMRIALGHLANSVLGEDTA